MDEKTKDVRSTEREQLEPDGDLDRFRAAGEWHESPGIDVTAQESASGGSGARRKQAAELGEAEIGEIIGLATRLQMNASAAPRTASPTSIQQVEEIARSLGIEPKFLEQAIEIVRVRRGSFELRGTLTEARQRLVDHFSSALWSSGGQNPRLIAPRLSIPGSNRVLVEWDSQSLLLDLESSGNDRVQVCWQTASEEPTAGGAVTNAIFGALAVVPGIGFLVNAGWAAALLWTAFVGTGMVSARLLQKQESSLRQRRFQEFCRSHAQNLRLLSAPE